MKANLPVKNLILLHWLFAIVISTIVFLFLFQNKLEKHTVLYTIMTGIAVRLIGYANIYFSIILNKKFKEDSKKFKRYRYLSTYTASAVVYFTLWPIFAYLADKTWSYADLSLLSMFIISSALVNTVMIILQDFILLQTEKAKSDLEIANLKTAHAEAANLLLKQQIHPHFLFNALNTLKALYWKDLGEGDIYIVHLANFLRASIFNHSAKVCTLEDELSLLCDYLEMQKIRFGTALVCIIDLPAEILTTFYLPSFSLQPLLENALKHNELTQELPLEVRISYEGERIIVKNNLRKKSMNISSINHGLANLAERYRIWSGDEVIIKEENGFFSVSIKLLTNEYSDHRG